MSACRENGESMCVCACVRACVCTVLRSCVNINVRHTWSTLAAGVHQPRTAALVYLDADDVILPRGFASPPLPFAGGEINAGTASREKPPRPAPPVTDTHRLRLTERVLHFRCLCTRTDGSGVFTWLLMRSSSWWICRTYPEWHEMVQRSPL